MKISKLKLASGVVVAATASTANAQSSVTLYGIADAAITFSSKTASASGGNAGKSFAVADGGGGPSLFGMLGVEDLGSGLKAEFRLESGINVANGGFNSSNGNFFGRQAWVGLDGDFGAVKAGLQRSPFFIALYESDPRNYSGFASALLLYAENVAVTGAFNSNAVTYTSPKLAGFQGQAMLALGGSAGDFSAGRQWSGSLKYENGPLMMNAAIYDGNSGGTVQTPVPSTVAFEGRTMGAGYTFGSLTFKASFVNYKVAHSFNSNIYGGGVDFRLTPSVELNGGVWYTTDRDDTVNHSVLAAVGASYHLSPRTSLYAQIGTVNNHGAMRTGLSVTDTSLLRGTPGTSIGGDIGIRHSF
ncbi:porin [Paraburkholderia sp. 1N]|uniref:Porin n=1 Tax=Paraburkholderia solitsugae TaxID=2675748 RepID=A0ABX2C5I6_9BURK|nr:porin [Paraburkholderia solitsugae]NPT47250.1 porin [Paraburkholderia solitsugae]